MGKKKLISLFPEDEGASLLSFFFLTEYSVYFSKIVHRVLFWPLREQDVFKFATKR